MFKNKITRQFTQIEVDKLTNNCYPLSPQMNSGDIFQWRMREDFSPYQIRCHLQEMGYTIKQPIWTFLLRMGQSVTELPDGTKVSIAGEYEDYYDPDFKIYNDVMIQKMNGEIQLWHYPIEQFPPTDFHTAYYDQVTHSIFLIGNLGYPENRKEDSTQVLRLNLNTLEIEKLECFGNIPSWLHHHEMKVINQHELEFSNGHVIKNKKYLRNLYTWRLNIRTLEWSLPKQTIFDHWTLKSEHYYGFPFFECHQLLWDEENITAEEFEQSKQKIINHLGYLPNYKVYRWLYIPLDDAIITQDEHEYSKYISNLYGYTLWYFENDDLMQAVFPDHIPYDFQKFLLNDLVYRLKQITGHDVIVEKVV